MDALEIARWQFGITTVYHFMMVPLTIGLGLVVAVIQTVWYRTGKPEYLRMTKFWGKLFLINFIMGVATGIVQEFQFGMAWSEYSRFVGDVFGAPLALEALLAFFVESTFLGLWIFGWKQLKRGVHLACLWIAVIGSVFSAYFIIVANSWMQHPVGVEMVNGRPVMTDAWAVFTNNTALVAVPHTLFGALAVAGGFLLGIAWYHLWRRRHDGIDTVGSDGKVVPGEADIPGRDKADYKVWIRSLRIGAVVAMISFAGTALTGDLQGKLMFEQQPMKMAAAEAACHDGTGFSVLSVGNLGSKNCDDIVAVIEVPGHPVLPRQGRLHHRSEGRQQPAGPVQGRLRHPPPGQPHLRRPRRPGNRVRSRHGSDLLGLPDDDRLRRPGGPGGPRGALGDPQGHRPRVPRTDAAGRRSASWPRSAPTLPAGSSPKWAASRSSWRPNPDPSGIDQVFMFTAAAVSPGVSAGELLTSLVVLTAVYAVLLVVEVKLLVKYIRGGVVSAMPELAHAPADENEDATPGPGGTGKPGDSDDVLAFAY